MPIIHLYIYNQRPSINWAMTVFHLDLFHVIFPFPYLVTAHMSISHLYIYNQRPSINWAMTVFHLDSFHVIIPFSDLATAHMPIIHLSIYNQHPSKNWAMTVFHLDSFHVIFPLSRLGYSTYAHYPSLYIQSTSIKKLSHDGLPSRLVSRYLPSF